MKWKSFPEITNHMLNDEPSTQMPHILDKNIRTHLVSLLRHHAVGMSDGSNSSSHSNDADGRRGTVFYFYRMPYDLFNFNVKRFSLE